MKEVRNLDNHIWLRSTEGEASRHVEGYALVFESESKDLGGFTEVISRNALDGVLEDSDVLALLNHDVGRGVLARWRGEEGSLKLEIDKKGLRYSFDAPNTSLGDELLEGLQRGDISQSSFAFTVEKESWEKLGDGRYLRTIEKIKKIYDVSPVYNPAYDDTSVVYNSRGLEDIKKKEREELYKYYDNLKKRIPE